MSEVIPRVLIADDHARVRQALRMLLELDGEIEVVGEAANGLEAVEKAAELQPDILLLDLVMPVMDGVQAGTIIAQRFPQIRIIILTSSVEHDLDDTMQRTHARQVLLKNAPPSDFTQVILNLMDT